MASPSHAGSYKLLPDTRESNLHAFVGFQVIAGLLNSLIAAFLLGRLPESHARSLSALLIRASIYVFVATLAGTLGAWLYWRRSSIPSHSDPPLSFSLFALTNGAGWVWVPSIVILSTQDSPASAAITAIAAALLAAGLRKTIPATTESHEMVERELFAESLRTPPREAHAYVIAICIYAAFFALHDQSNLLACTLFAPCVFLLVWKLTLAPGLMDGNKYRTALRLLCIAVPAIVGTFFTLQMGAAHRRDTASSQVSNRNQKIRHAVRNSQSGISGYESVILWPVPKKKEIVYPLPLSTSPFAAGKAKPFVIRFDGPYWYFQAPGKEPGPKAHMAHGDPLNVSIQSNNFFPLTMEAHQHLGTAIHLASCREIQVAIENRDNRPGTIALGILLTDSASPGKPTLYLGQQTVVSSEPSHFTIKSFPAEEVLRFPTPSTAKIRKFDEITVIFLPDTAHIQMGPKIAIQQFELIPR